MVGSAYVDVVVIRSVADVPDRSSHLVNDIWLAGDRLLAAVALHGLTLF